MSHESAPSSGENLEQQNGTPETYYGSEVPEFDPDRATELKQEAVETNETTEAAEVSPSTESQEIPSTKTPEDRLNLNRDTYNELARRRAFIKSQYPDIQNAPKTIFDEYANCGFIMTYLGDGVTAHMNSPLMVDPVSGKRVVIDAFSQDKFNKATRDLTKLKSANASLLDAEAEKNFQLPKVDVEAYAQRIEQAATPEEAIKVQQEIREASQNADMDTMFALRKLSRNMNAKAGAFHKDEVTNEYAKLQESAKKAEDALKSAQEKWKKAGPFKKLSMMMRGENNFSSLENTLSSARKTAEAYYRQNENWLSAPSEKPQSEA